MLLRFDEKAKEKILKKVYQNHSTITNIIKKRRRISSHMALKLMIDFNVKPRHILKISPFKKQYNKPKDKMDLMEALKCITPNNCYSVFKGNKNLSYENLMVLVAVYDFKPHEIMDQFDFATREYPHRYKQDNLEALMHFKGK